MIARHFTLVCIATAATSAALAAHAPGSFFDSRPFQIIQNSPANYPMWLANEGVMRGQARAVINVDADGKLADCLVIAYSHPAFARELLASARAWSYRPAYERGQPVGTRTELTFNFEAKGMVVSVSPGDSVISHINRLLDTPMTSFLAKPSELDQPLAPIDPVRPRHPGKLLQPEQLDGTVQLDFYIDQEGRPRMPVVLRSTHDLFARAVLEAVDQWKFPPPTRAGQPVVVRVVQEFVFRPGSS